MIFKIKVAKQLIQVESVYRTVFHMCESYLENYESQSEIQIKTTQKDIDNEMKKSNDGNYYSSYAETLSVYRKIAEAMLDYSTFLMHGSVVATDMEHAYMFTASSGTGKTTHTKLWLSNLESSFVVNGDKPLLKVESNRILACGTPWCGKEGWNTNCMVPLKGIVILERAEHNSIEEISFGQAFPILLQQTYRPKDAEKMKQTLGLLKELSKHVKFYKMQVNNFEPDAFKTSYEMITHE